MGLVQPPGADIAVAISGKAELWQALQLRALRLDIDVHGSPAGPAIIGAVKTDMVETMDAQLQQHGYPVLSEAPSPPLTTR